MKRLVHDKDFDGTVPQIRDSMRVNRWGVCVVGYELKSSTQQAPGSQWLRARRPFRLTSIDGKDWKTYKPLEETPDLFLRFARLARKPPTKERALVWCQEHGVLGLAGDYHWGWTGENKAHQAYESLESFNAEVDRAAGVLALYEAALNRDHEAAVYFASDKYSQISAELWDSGIRQNWDSTLVQEMVQAHAGGDYLAYALEAASWIVESTVRGSCYPTLRAEQGDNPSNIPSDVQGGWGFKNLRGAMYLQMYWLMAAGGNIARCQYCGGVIDLSSGGEGNRKTRQDKKFCDAACRQRYHYHNKTKPTREAKTR